MTRAMWYTRLNEEGFGVSVYIHRCGRAYVNMNTFDRKCVGIDVVTALEYARKHPYIADDSYYDCIRPHVDIMMFHVRTKEAENDAQEA